MVSWEKKKKKYQFYRLLNLLSDCQDINIKQDHNYKKECFISQPEEKSLKRMWIVNIQIYL